MSKCCKGSCWTKFLPHNWLCLKGLYVTFVVLFYIVFVFAIITAVEILNYPMLSGLEMWKVLGTVELRILGTALGLLTVAKILKSLAKIKNAVAPCCCQEEKTEKKTKKEEKAK